MSIPVIAQEAYPSRLVKFVVPFTAGGPLDVMARFMAQKLAEEWGKPVVVENQAGGSGSIGAAAVARAPADGYTLLVTVDIPLTMYPAVAKQVPYNPRTDFRPIAAVARSDNGLFVNPSLGVSTTKELVELAKKQPGKLSFSSAGVAAPAHFAGELFNGGAGGEAEGARRDGSATSAAPSGREAARGAGVSGPAGIQLVRRARAGEDARCAGAGRPLGLEAGDERSDVPRAPERHGNGTGVGRSRNGVERHRRRSHALARARARCEDRSAAVKPQ